jgi:hypothetical protein
MSTNFLYFAGKAGEARHIGRRAVGWCFMLHVYPKEGIFDLSDWERLFAAPGSRIEDEYAAVLSWKEMHAVITQQSWRGKQSSANLRSPTAASGPNGLLREPVDGVRV